MHLPFQLLIETMRGEVQWTFPQAGVCLGHLSWLIMLLILRIIEVEISLRSQGCSWALSCSESTLFPKVCCSVRKVKYWCCSLVFCHIFWLVSGKVNGDVLCLGQLFSRRAFCICWIKGLYRYILVVYATGGSLLPPLLPLPLPLLPILQAFCCCCLH